MLAAWFTTARTHTRRRRFAQVTAVAAEVEKLESRVMLSATSLAGIVENIVDSHSTSEWSDRIQTKFERFTTHINSGHSSEVEVESSRLTKFLDHIHQPSHEHGGVDIAHRALEGIAEHSHPNWAEQLDLNRFVENNPLARLADRLTEALTEISEKVEATQTTGTLSEDDVLGGLLDGIAEHFDIDFGPGDGSGCGTAETDAFIPDAIGSVDLSSACSTHDAAYATLGKPKVESDLEFFHDVFEAGRSGGADGGESLLLAGVYFGGVFIFGGPAYQAAQEAAMQS